ncbi:hypothetical protein HanXRQr2_Chr11g0466681 [Helianthus annuus]|uniref:Transmembrane protein n=1 Tax=Helianthus annuus TaxID=4232 RepID=A0A251T5Y3_HELAN|nr:uncharacterized protein LOC110889050 isoform X1 [Helianthus annuus]KAF5779959.1 hypothetical protein HanXRQr2_Chr11g0466681 [Helianthus annuus]
MAVASASMLVALKTFFIISAWVMAAVLVYSFAADGQASCFQPSEWWMQVAEYDYIVIILPIMALFFYKESSWIKRIGFIIISFFCGSFVNCGYIAILFYQLSPEESMKDPLYFVLARRQNRDVNTGRTARYSLVIAKVMVTAIGCYLLGVIIFAYITDGSPFHMEVLTPCMITAIIDISIHTVVYSVWIAYKETSWISAVFWIIVLVCFSSIGLFVYILRELFTLSPEQPLSVILFNKTNRDRPSSDPLLNEHTDV